MGIELTLRIILQTPPADTNYGIQKGTGNNYETIQTQRSTGKDLKFVFTINTKTDKNNALDFSGPIVQGKAGERFIYVDIGTYAGQQNSIWGRRLKVPLTGISDTINQQSAGNAIVLETKVAGTGKDGGPNCATVKPFTGWYLSK